MQEVHRLHRTKRLLGLNAFQRHQKFVADYIKFYRGKLPENQQDTKSDQDVLREHYRFIRDEADDKEDTWEVRLAKRYYSKLFKEYCIADLSRYKEGKVGMRWRTEREVVAGKGQFICGAKGCSERRGLASFEVNFKYKEAGQAKQALVKLRVCHTHALHLNHKANDELLRSARKQRRKRKREESLRDQELLQSLRKEALQQTLRHEALSEFKSRTSASPHTAKTSSDAGAATDSQGGAGKGEAASSSDSDEQSPAQDGEFGQIFIGMFD